MNHFALRRPNGEVFDYLDGIKLDDCYQDGEFSESLFGDKFYDIWIQLCNSAGNGEFLVDEEVVEQEELVDEGWLMDVDENVVSYFNERQLELNS